MFRRAIVVALAAVTIATIGLPVVPVSLGATTQCTSDASWTGGGDGVHWSDPKNWSDNTRPTGHVCTLTVEPHDPEAGTKIDDGNDLGYGTNLMYAADNVSIIGNTEFDSGALTVWSSISVIGGTFTNGVPVIPGGPDVPGRGGGLLDLECQCDIFFPIVLRGNVGRLSGGGQVTMQAPLQWTAGAIDLDLTVGDLTIDGDATLIPLTHTLTGRITIPVGGTVLWTDSNNVLVESDLAPGGGLIVNEGRFTVLGGDHRMVMDPGNVSRLDNRGDLLVAATGRTEFGIYLDSELTSTITVQQGTLALTAGGARDGTFDAGPGTAVELGDLYGNNGVGTPIDFTREFTSDGPVTLDTRSSPIRFSGTVDILGAVSVVGDVQFDTGHAVTLSQLTLGDPTHPNLGGRIAGGDPVTVTGPTTIYTGGTGGSGTLTAAGGVTKSPDGSLYLQGRSLVNGGIFDWKGGQIHLSGQANVTNTGGGIVEVLGDRSVWLDSGASSAFVNEGLVRIVSGVTLMLKNVDYVQQGGSTRLENGTLTVTRGVQVRGGALTGTGTVNGGIDNSGGTVSPGFSPGTLTVGGPYVQGPGGTFELELAGPQDADRDRLIVQSWQEIPGYFPSFHPGNLSMGGTLRVSHLNGFTPAPGATFPFLSADSTIDGAFATVSAPGGRTATTCVDAGTVSLALDTTTCGVPPTPTADLSITKTNGVTSATAGQPITYTIIAANAGPDAVVGASVTDAIPAVLTGATWTCTATAGSTCGAASGTGGIGTTVSLAAGGSATFSLTATLASTATGTLANTATIAAPAGTLDGDPANDQATDIDTITAPPVLAITSDSTLPSGAVQSPYAVALWATGTTVAPTWSLAPRSRLPKGLDLSATGIITGTPTRKGAFTFTIQVVSGPATASRTFTLTIVKDLKITTKHVADGRVGKAYADAVAAKGGIVPYAWSITAGALPAGLALDGVTGAITGTPTVKGRSTFDVTVTDADGDTATQGLTINVK